MLNLTLSIFFAFNIICLLLILVFATYISWHFKYWLKRGVAGPHPLLWHGTFPKSSTGKCNLVTELHEIYLAHKAKHRYVGVFTARSPKLFILDPKLANEILTTHFKSFRNNESSQWTSPRIEKLRTCSPFVSIDEAWKERRAELAPALATSRLRAFYTIMQQSAKRLSQFIETQQNESLNAKELANRYTAEFISNFIWGIEAQAFSSNSSISTIHEMAKIMLTQSLKCVRYYGKTAVYPWLRRFRPVRFFPAASDQFFQQLAAQSMQLRRSSSSSSSLAARCDVINHLLQLSEKKFLNDVQIAGHTTTTLIDGYETVAIVIAHCLLLLSLNQRVQHKLRLELQQAKEISTLDELNNLPYLEQCLNETLRIFPPLSTIFKLCTEAITLQNYDHTELHLKPNDVVYISSYSFQHDADFYELPEDFWPERFDEVHGGARKYRDMSVFLPFGDGPRICPGMKLGLAEAKVAIAEIVKNFKLTSAITTRKDNKIAADSFLLTLDGDIDLHFKKI